MSQPVTTASTTKVSDYLVSRIPELTGSRHIFMLAGGGMMHLLDSLGKGFVVPVATHHEQAAAFAAYAYGRTLNSTGVCFVTSGPGGTNAVTGVAAAWTDSVPMLYVSGQVSTASSLVGTGLRQRGFQELDILEVVRPITKYAAYVPDKQRLRYELEKACHLARSGRPGPVWLDVPLDVQASSFDPSQLSAFDPAELGGEPNPAPDEATTASIVARLKAAKRPLILLGHGVSLSGSGAAALRLLERLRVPVQTTWNALDLVPEQHPLFFGRANAYGPRAANFVIQNADYILSLGARLGIQHTGYNIEAFARGAHIDMVELDELEAKKPQLRVGRFLKLDAGKTIAALLAAPGATLAAPEEWLSYCRRIKATYPNSPPLAQVADEPYVDPYCFYDVLSDELPEGALVPLGSSGTCFTVSGQVFKSKPGQRVFHAKGMAAMGMGLPSAFGASIARDGMQAVTVIGDGGLMLNLQELQSIAHHQLPIKVFVINNEGYHAIRVTQDTYFQKRYVGSTPESGVSLPSLEKLAALFGFGYSRIANNRELKAGIAAALAAPGPALIDVRVDPSKALMPKLSSYLKPDGTMASRPLEDLAPLLERDELKANMFIEPLT
jgi:acetolactate synthase-1/2/3 large subunit